MATKKVKTDKKEKVVKSADLTVPMYSSDGKEAGKMELPEEIFGVKVSKSLIAQAVRVYFNNLRAHYSNTKTRAEVAGSTRKIYKQKGTGGARHGAIRAPIFVHGGIALGPKFRKVILNLPDKMKRAALKSALSNKFQNDAILGVVNLEKVEGKTSQAAKFLKGLNKKDLLLILGEKNEKVQRSFQNLQGAEVILADQLNAFEVVGHKTLAFTEEAVKKIESRIMNHELKKEEKG